MAANDLAVLIAVFAARTLVPVTVLRWPFWGGLASILADATDTMIQDALGSDVLSRGANYHVFDKLFDTYYLSWEVEVLEHVRAKVEEQPAYAGEFEEHGRGKPESVEHKRGPFCQRV